MAAAHIIDWTNESVLWNQQNISQFLTHVWPLGMEAGCARFQLLVQKCMFSVNP